MDFDFNSVSNIFKRFKEAVTRPTGQAGGRRGRRRSSSKKRSKTLKGGSAVIGAALVPFGLLGLQKYFQSRKYSRGSSSSTRRRMSRSVRRKSALKLSEEPV